MRNQGTSAWLTFGRGSSEVQQALSKQDWLELKRPIWLPVVPIGDAQATWDRITRWRPCSSQAHWRIGGGSAWQREFVAARFGIEVVCEVAWSLQACCLFWQTLRLTPTHNTEPKQLSLWLAKSRPCIQSPRPQVREV